jgi:hypothetical protein
VKNNQNDGGWAKALVLCHNIIITHTPDKKGKSKSAEVTRMRCATATTTITTITTTHYWEIENKDVIVIPSLSLDAHELQNITGVGHYEGEDEGKDETC